MKGILTTLILVCALGLSAQTPDSCVYDRNEVDEFTGQEVVSTKYSPIWEGFAGFVKIQVTRFDNEYALIIGMNIGEIYAIDEGAKLMFILENDSVVSTISMFYSIAEGRYIERVGITSWFGHTSYYLEKSIRESLAAFTIKKFRLYTTDGYIEHDVPQEFASVIKNAIACVD